MPISLATVKAERIIHNLTDRKGFDDWWFGIDQDIRDEICKEIAEVIEGE